MQRCAVKFFCIFFRGTCSVGRCVEFECYPDLRLKHAASDTFRNVCKSAGWLQHGGSVILRTVTTFEHVSRCTHIGQQRAWSRTSAFAKNILSAVDVPDSTPTKYLIKVIKYPQTRWYITTFLSPLALGVYHAYNTIRLKQAYVRVNNYSFDGLYRRHHPPHAHSDDGNGDDTQNMSRGGGEGLCADERKTDAHGKEGDTEAFPSPALPLARPDRVGSYASRLKEIMREEYGTFFDGMTPTAQELYQVTEICGKRLTYRACSHIGVSVQPSTTPLQTAQFAIASNISNQHMTNDVESWGTVEDSINKLLCLAAFFVVEHPSPATRAELAAAREKDHLAKVRDILAVRSTSVKK